MKFINIFNNGNLKLAIQYLANAPSLLCVAIYHKGIIAQDPEKRVAVQNILYDHNDANETNLNLLRYDMVS